MTKTAQLAVARGLAETLAGTDVTVNAVLPGPTVSEGVGQFVADLARDRGVDAKTVEREFFVTARPSSILQRFASAEEVAATDRLRLQHQGLGHERRGAARRRRRGARHRLTP